MNRRATKVRICIVASSLKVMGGQSVQAEDLKTRFRQEGISAEILPINPSFSGFAGRLQQIKYLRTLITWPTYLMSLLLTIPRFDVLHLFSASYLSFLLAPAPAAIIGKFYGKRVILNYHSGEAEDHLKRSLKTIKSVLRFVDHLAVPSEYLNKVFERFALGATVIPNVIDFETFCFRDRQLFRPRFIVSRNLEPLYNVQCVLRAFEIIQERFPDAVLTVLGSGSQEIQLKELTAQLGLKNVTFTGKVERTRIAQFYADHDIMLNASNIDNMPLSVMEAFASGLPVVSTVAGGIPYLIDHLSTGMLVPLNDQDALAASAMVLLEQQDLAKSISKRAHEQCRERYSWDVIRDQWLELYGARC